MLVFTVSSPFSRSCTDLPVSIIADKIKIADLGQSVQITDENSGAVFGFRKYR